MILVADYSALVALSVCNSLRLLEQLFASVAVPETVYWEATRPDKQQAQALKQFLQGKVHQVDTMGSLGILLAAKAKSLSPETPIGLFWPTNG